MAAKKKNLSFYEGTSLPDAGTMRIGIVVSEWNREVTGALLEGAVKILEEQGIKPENLHIHHVPGSFELPTGAAFLAESGKVDAVICLGCVIQGETRHFEFIAQAVANGCTNLSLKTNIPVIFGVLTTDTFEQAKERSGGKHGNKGDEAAITAIKMVELKNKIKQ